MKYPVRLFLGDMEVEFSTPPEILFNYSETELTNPTIVKNSYSKTITIEGTPNNNKIFGHIYNLERILAYDGTTMGTSFNPLVKTDFTLYYNSSIYESGYFKLDEIRRNDNNIEYDITLYGGLGDFFYNLSYKEDGNSMELSDLIFENEDSTGEELGFTINKETVHDAWLYLWQPSSKWDTINFAPCYNGKPSNIATDKFLINRRTGSIFPYSYSGFTVGTSEHEHTEWETFDLRSYLQRPVLRVRETIKAICDPINNGGYTVNLDEDFFNSDNRYYWDSWMTLPMLSELDVPATVESALSINSITQESTYVYNVWDNMGNATNVAFNMGVRFNPTDSYTGNSIYLIRSYWSDGGVTLQSDFVKAFCSDTCITIQMYGYNDSGQIAATSDMYYLTSWVSDNFYFKNDIEFAKRVMNGEAEQTTSVEKPTQPRPDINNVILSRGKFTKKNGQYVWTNENGVEQTLKFRFPSNTELTQLKLKIVVYTRGHLDRTFWGADTNEQSYLSISGWSEKVANDNAYHNVSYVTNLKRVNGTFSYIPKGATGTTTSYEGFFSGRKYTKKDLLTLGVTPANFLLSYAKMFGLYFIKDVESKTIDILTRHNFYERDNVVNINDLIDKGSDITIEPTSPKYQYYDFGLEPVESEAGASYQKTYGTVYGTQVINTNYQYEKEHKALLDKNIFKSAVNVLERNKYFQKPTNGNPCLIYNGFSYTYIDSTGGTQEGKITPKTMTGETINPDGLRYYDRTAKPQFHKEDNEPTDGAFVLLFCDDIDYDAGNYGYHITDDIARMYTLNDGQPCWIMTSGTTDIYGNTIALTVDRLPIFTRDVYVNDNVSDSFDLGTPRTLYVPNKYVTDWQSIYSKGWKSYITDLYDGNTRVLKCRCLLRERPNPNWLRRFYWFDNCYWRLNKIKDWNISSYGTTEMEFIKVQDINNYDNVEFTYLPIVTFYLDSYTIGAEGGVIEGNIYISNGVGYWSTDAVPVEYSNGAYDYLEPAWVVTPTRASGAVNVPIKLSIPANTSAYTRTINYTIEDNYDHFHGVSIEQGSGFTGSTMVMATTTFPKTGGTYNATVVATENWHIEYPSWAYPSVRNGSAGQYDITIQVYSNGTSNTRTGSLRIGNKTISIVQFGQ